MQRVGVPANTNVTSERAQNLSVFVRGGGPPRVFWNAEPVFSVATYRRPERGAPMYSRIIVPIDGSDFAWRAFDTARTLAR